MYTPRLIGVSERPAASSNVRVTFATDSATVRVAIALASADVSPTTTNDSFSFEHPPASATTSDSAPYTTASRDGRRRSVERARMGARGYRGVVARIKCLG